MSTIINATTTNGVVIQPDNSGSLQLATNSGTTALTIDTSQNVGIGTTSPTNKLTVNGSGRFYGAYTEDTTNIGIHAGYTSSTPRIGFFNGTAAQNWQIDNSSGNFRWFTPGVEQMVIMADGTLKFNSGYGSAAPAYGCRAWVNFNGTGTPAIRGSGNVTSITDNGTGNYTVNITTAMPDVNYCFIGTSGDVSGTGDRTLRPYTYATSSVAFNSTLNGSSSDPANVNVAIFR
jgi:hypothetical protein